MDIAGKQNPVEASRLPRRVPVFIRITVCLRVPRTAGVRSLLEPLPMRRASRDVEELCVGKVQITKNESCPRDRQRERLSLFQLNLALLNRISPSRQVQRNNCDTLPTKRHATSNTR